LRELAVAVAVGAVEALHDLGVARRLGERKLPVAVQVERAQRLRLVTFALGFRVDGGGPAAALTGLAGLARRAGLPRSRRLCW
jgi:hypothetical protein